MIRETLCATSTCALVGVLAFCSASPSLAQQQLAFTPFRSSGIYALGETAGWDVSATPKTTCHHYTYTAKENNATLLMSGNLDLTTGKAQIAMQVSEPAMILVQVDAACSAVAQAKPATPQHKKASMTSEAVLGAAIDPTQLRPVVPAPADFDEFWQGKLKQLKSVPMNPHLLQVPSGDPAVNLYMVKLRSVGSHVQGYLAVPPTEGKHPALILYQYAGVYALKPEESVKYAAQGWLTFDVDSHDIPPFKGDGVPTDYFRLGENSRETSYFLNMYLRDTRALQYIRSRPDWDGKTIVLMGTSMGGQQSLATAGLNPKWITAVIVDEPAGADTNSDLHGRKAGYPYWPSNDAKAMEASRYFDPINFAPHIKAATILAMGFIDTTAPPTGLWTVFNQLGGPKEAVPMIDAAHTNKTPQRLGKFIERSKQALDMLLHGGSLQLHDATSAQ